MANQLTLVILENFYQCCEDPLAKDLFGQMAALKCLGYSNIYGDGVLAFDKDDLFGTHLLVCDKHQGNLRVLSGYKSVNYSSCKKFGFNFAIKNMIAANGSSQCLEELESVITKCEKEGHEISYDTTWTILPHVRNQPSSFKKTLKE
ncbi:MAG: hypothetical protein HOE90_02650 [Bacteriovoracaceae bacterium]|jgi:hypothetical protein|nr:hypothetical protein [Bacteriovoracaceae bacterium]